MFFLQFGRKDKKSCIKDIWNQIQPYFNDSLHFSQLIPRTVIYGFHNIDNDTFLIQNHIPLLLKLHIYNNRKYSFLSFNDSIHEINKIKSLERIMVVNNHGKCENKEWTQNGK